MQNTSKEERKTEEPRAEDYSILAWVIRNNLKNEKGDPIDFRDRLYLIDILCDWHKQIVIKKASQIGGSLIFNLKALFALMKLGFNVLYTFPTDSDTAEFVSSKTNKLLVQNPQVFQGMATDNIERKEINGRFLFFKGTVSKTAAIMTTADLLVHDEASRSDQQVVEMMRSRTKASKYGGRWLFSNPTTEKDAVDEAWQKSDQREWNITCTACNHEQILQWPESIDPERKCYQCQACKKELTREERRRGRWVAQRESEIHGYHMSHLMILDISAKQILEDSEGDQEYFFNFVLGEPYNPGDLRVSRSTILDNWTPKDLSLGKQWFLGVDVGNIKHYVLGTELGVVKVGRFFKWDELDDMMKMYDPALVIDAMPDNTMSKYYVDTYPRALMSFFKENMDNPQTIVWWGVNTGSLTTERNRQGIVYSNRNRIIDKMIDDILNAHMLFGLASDKDLKDFLKHWETLRRIKVTNNRGIESYEWDSTTGEDHYVFATLYYYLARLSIGSGSLFTLEPAKPEDLIDQDGNVGDLGAIMSEVNDWPTQ